MMKKNIATILFTILFSSTFAQIPIDNFLGNSNQWFTYFGHLTYEFYTSNDTMVNGQQYKKVMSSQVDSTVGVTAYLDGYIREDTINKKVYYLNVRDFGFVQDTAEILLYDFDVDLGDTIQIQEIYQHHWKSYVVYDTFSCDSSFSPYFKYDCENQFIIQLKPTYTTANYNLYWISSVGSISGLEDNTVEIGYNLVCAFKNGQHIVEGEPYSQPPYGIGCNYQYVGTSEVFKSPQFEVFPNPVQHQLELKIQEWFTGELYISNVLGQVVWSSSWDGDFHQTIDLSFLMNGSYFLFVKNENGELIQTIQLVKLDD